MEEAPTIPDFEGFDWSGGNAEKNWVRHQVTQSEAEQVFFNRPLVVAEDEFHSEHEARYYSLGKTNEGRALFVVFTPRGKAIRIISARDMSRKERRVYESS